MVSFSCLFWLLESASMLSYSSTGWFSDLWITSVCQTMILQKVLFFHQSPNEYAVFTETQHEDKTFVIFQHLTVIIIFSMIKITINKKVTILFVCLSAIGSLDKPQNISREEFYNKAPPECLWWQFLWSQCCLIYWELSQPSPHTLLILDIFYMPLTLHVLQDFRKFH